MTEIQSDEAQRPVPLHERYGINQEDCLDAIGQSQVNSRKLTTARDKIRQASDLLEFLMGADALGANGQDYDLSHRAYEQLLRVDSLLKSAAKKIDKHQNQQFHRDIENWKQGGAS